MNLLHVITTLGIGGAERHLLALLPDLLRRGHTIELAFLKGAGELRFSFERAGIRVHDLSRRSWRARRRLLRSWIRDRRYDLVHSHLLKANVLCELARGRDCPHVRGVHNDEAWLRRPFVNSVHRHVFARPSHVVVPTQHVADFLVERRADRAERITLIPYGLDAVAPADDVAWRAERESFRASLGLPPDAFVALCLARFAKQKGQRAFLHAIAALPVDERIHLVFAGGDPWQREEPRVRTLLETSPWRAQVHLIGPCAEPRRLMRHVDVLFVPSRWEGLGLVAVEAMEAGLPVIASDLPALREVLGDVALGFVPLDAGEPWLRIFQRVLTGAIDGAEHGVRGRERFRVRHARERMVREHERLYRSLLR